MVKQRFNGSQTAQPAPENGVLAPDAKGIVYYDKAKFHAGFVPMFL
jgi:hypothetical protein